MRLIEFKTGDKYENEYKIFINPEYIESLYTVTNKSMIRISMISGNSIDVNHTLEEVKEKLGVDIESTDYKRTDEAH